MIQVTYTFNLNDIDELIYQSHRISNTIRHYYSQMGIKWPKTNVKKTLKR